MDSTWSSILSDSANLSNDVFWYWRPSSIIIESICTTITKISRVALNCRKIHSSVALLLLQPLAHCLALGWTVFMLCTALCVLFWLKYSLPTTVVCVVLCSLLLCIHCACFTKFCLERRMGRLWSLWEMWCSVLLECPWNVARQDSWC